MAYLVSGSISGGGGGTGEGGGLGAGGSTGSDEGQEQPMTKRKTRSNKEYVKYVFIIVIIYHQESNNTR